MRARMALWISGISVELREVELKAKPSALIAASPKATVPVLQLTSGIVLDESLHIMEWALAQNDPEGWLGNAEQRSQAAVLIEENDGPFKGHLDRYKYPERCSNAASRPARQQGQEFLQILEQALMRQNFLVSPRRSLADIAIFPFVRQFSLVEPAWFIDSPYPNLRSWLNILATSELFSAAMQKYPVWTEGQRPIIFGKTPHL